MITVDNPVLSVHDIRISSIDGKEHMLAEFSGYVCLHVNIATKTGYVPKTKKLWSYARTAKHLFELQKLHEMFKDNKFTVIGYPCNQFHNMEQGTNEEILENIKSTYPFVTFPISEKINVNGPDEHDVWRFLKGDQVRAVDDTAADTSKLANDGQNKAGGSVMRIPSNYEKFITNRHGKQYWRFNWAESPISPALTVGSPSVIEIIKEIL